MPNITNRSAPRAPPMDSNTQPKMYYDGIYPDLMDVPMIFVNPQDVHPIATQTHEEDSQQVSVDGPAPIHMEQFADLSALLLAQNAPSCAPYVSTLELNTPVFDKGEFNYPISSTATTTPAKVKVEYVPMSSYETALHNTAYSPTEGVDLLEEIANFNMYVKDNSCSSSPQDERCSTPNEGVAAREHFKLHLMTTFPVKEETMLNTPDVIDDVDCMGNNFNILDLVNSEEMTVISNDEDFLSTLTSPASCISSQPPTPSFPTPSESRKRTHSSKYDDDYDYTPPGVSRTPSVDSDSSEDYYPADKKGRGRPPKTADSRTKYRELRDKNNEASRKSRLKRKNMDKQYEKECDELYSRNIRLKTQVEELEKMVSTFRNNLFNILIKK